MYASTRRCQSAISRSKTEDAKGRKRVIFARKSLGWTRDSGIRSARNAASFLERTCPLLTYKRAFCAYHGSTAASFQAASRKISKQTKPFRRNRIAQYS